MLVVTADASFHLLSHLRLTPSIEDVNCGQHTSLDLPLWRLTRRHLMRLQGLKRLSALTPCWSLLMQEARERTDAHRMSRALLFWRSRGGRLLRRGLLCCVRRCLLRRRLLRRRLLRRNLLLLHH